MRGSKYKKLNNRGSALILVITIISFIAILGAMTMSTALLNIKMRGLNRDSDKNFYNLEIALDEIYAQTGRVSSEILKDEYAAILSGLYQTDPTSKEKLDTNEKANDELKKRYMNELKDTLQLNPDAVSDADKKTNCEHAAEVFKGYAESFVKDNSVRQNFSVTVESVTFQKKAAEGTKSRGLNDIYSSIAFNGLCLTYLNPETDIESSLTVDMKIDVPYVRFINSGSTLLDYVVVANGGITIGDTSGEKSKHQFELNGNIYGNAITINNAAAVSVDAGLMTAAGNLTVNQGSLEIGKSADFDDSDDDDDSEDTRLPAGRNKVWATGIELDAQATLDSKNTDFYILDDMTLKGGGNKVSLNGGYYGYGNEGMEPEEIKMQNPSYSSAIILNGKKDILDLRGLNSLMLAGRAYLRFNSGDAAQTVYPLGESLAVKSTQSMYLVPESCMTVTPNGGTAKKAEMNPVLFPTGDSAPESITISVDTTTSILGSKGKKGEYIITKEQAAGEGKIELGDGNGPAFCVAIKGKIYVYYNFASNAERSDYFKEYLKTKGDSFEELLRKSGVTGNDGSGASEDAAGIYVNEDGQILTSGALYQVAGKSTDSGEEDKPIFELLSVGQDQVSTSLKWVDLGKQFKTSFQNLKENLAETKRVTGTRETGTGPGKTDLLPVGNYVRISELDKANNADEKVNPIIYKDNVKLDIEGNWDGLVVSGGNVEVSGSGTFNGLIIAKGSVTIKCDEGEKIVMNSDSSTYEALLEDEDISKYFYDYSDAASTVLNNYEDFVTRENWSRTGLEQGGAGGD